MAERDGAAIDIELRRIRAVVFQPSCRHRGKASLTSYRSCRRSTCRLFQRALGGVQRRVQHDDRIAADHGHMVDPRHRLDAERFQALFVDTITPEAPSKSGWHWRRSACVLGDQFDAFDPVKADVEADALVDGMGVGRAIGAGDLQRNDLVLNLPPGLPRIARWWLS